MEKIKSWIRKWLGVTKVEDIDLKKRIESDSKFRQDLFDAMEHVLYTLDKGGRSWRITGVIKEELTNTIVKNAKESVQSESRKAVDAIVHSEGFLDALVARIKAKQL